MYVMSLNLFIPTFNLLQPKFEVTVDGPSVILRDTLEETFKVCARYTHGSNVKGTANVTFSANYLVTNHHNFNIILKFDFLLFK